MEQVQDVYNGSAVHHDGRGGGWGRGILFWFLLLLSLLAFVSAGYLLFVLATEDAEVNNAAVPMVTELYSEAEKAESAWWGIANVLIRFMAGIALAWLASYQLHRSQARRVENGCPQCGEYDFIRIRRKGRDRLLDLVDQPKLRYACRNCTWNGRLAGNDLAARAAMHSEYDISSAASSTEPTTLDIRIAAESNQPQESGVTEKAAHTAGSGMEPHPPEVKQEPPTKDPADILTANPQDQDPQTAISDQPIVDATDQFAVQNPGRRAVIIDTDKIAQLLKDHQLKPAIKPIAANIAASSDIDPEQFEALVSRAIAKDGSTDT